MAEHIHSQGGGHELAPEEKWAVYISVIAGVIIISSFIIGIGILLWWWLG